MSVAARSSAANKADALFKTASTGVRARGSPLQLQHPWCDRRRCCPSRCSAAAPLPAGLPPPPWTAQGPVRRRRDRSPPHRPGQARLEVVDRHRPRPARRRRHPAPEPRLRPRAHTVPRRRLDPTDIICQEAKEAARPSSRSLSGCARRSNAPTPGCPSSASYAATRAASRPSDSASPRSSPPPTHRQARHWARRLERPGPPTCAGPSASVWVPSVGSPGR